MEADLAALDPTADLRDALRVSQPTRPRKRGDRPRLALVLSGGGARGAYEAGVLRYIREDLAGDLGGPTEFDIIAGTSVGGIHACFVAATADAPATQGRLLCERWESFVLEEMVSFGIKDFMRTPATLLGSGRMVATADGGRRLGGVVDTSRIERVVRRLIPWPGIAINVQRGLFEALSVSATDIGSGKTVVFIETADGRIPSWSRDEPVRAQAVRMGPEHAIASAALPVLFPAVAVGERFYCDGGLRQNTPLSPALRLGADKLLVIGLRHRKPTSPVPEEAIPFPGAAFLVGKILDAFLLDHLDYDLDRLERFNAFARERRGLAPIAPAADHRPYREVEHLVIRPSVDIGAIASDVARQGRFKGSGGGPGIRLLRRLATTSGSGEADLLSYLLFDGEYAAELIRLGYQDARRQHEALARLVSSAVIRDDAPDS